MRSRAVWCWALGCFALAAVAKAGCGQTEVRVAGQTVELSGGHKAYLGCVGPQGEVPGSVPAGPTVILATGRGIGDHTGWSGVQKETAKFARVCSYDLPGGTVDDLVRQMHELFMAGKLAKPYVLVGTSLGGVLVRRYQMAYPSGVAGFVFADSAHEEMEWRDAAVAAGFDAQWNDVKYLRENGLLADHALSEWRDDVPMIVLERGERAPCEAFPGLSKAQCDGMNDLWHSFQVDLSKRSKYGQLRIVDGAGHSMVMSKPEVVAGAIREVIGEIGQQK